MPHVGMLLSHASSCFFVVLRSRPCSGALLSTEPYVEIDGDRVVIHTFVSFDFGPDGYVCISVETRMRKGQGYSAIAGLYRQYELYYVIGDERDLVRLRTNYRLEDVYLG